MPQLSQLFKTRGYNEINHIILKNHMNDLPAWLQISKLTKICKKVLRKQIGKTKIGLLRKQGVLSESMYIHMVNPLHLAIFHNNMPLVKYFCFDLQINLKKSLAVDFELLLQPTSRSTPYARDRDINNFTDKYSDFQFSRAVGDVSEMTPGGNSTET